MIPVLIGTHNRHKADEIARLVSGLGVQVRTLNDFPGIAPVEEDGDTLEQNAVKKAKYYG